MSKDNNVIFLHHSTGKTILRGATSKYLYKVFKNGDIQKWFRKYNKNNKTNYIFEDLYFPKKSLYGANNDPYDYYNIWVKNAGNNPFMEEPTLEILTKEYDLIIWKHCFPIGNIKEDTGNPDINSKEKRLENYKLQYNALKKKMHSFPNTKFIVWTGAALARDKTTQEKAKRMQEFVNWVKNDWNKKNDNIFIWDFYSLETEGDLYIKEKYTAGKGDSHPNKSFSKKVAPLFGERIIEVFEK